MYMILWKIESKKKDDSLKTDVYSAGIFKNYDDTINACVHLAKQNMAGFSQDCSIIPKTPISTDLASCKFSIGFDIFDFDEYDYIYHRYEVVDITNAVDGYTNKWPWILIGTFDGYEIPHQWNK